VLSGFSGIRLEVDAVTCHMKFLSTVDFVYDRALEDRDGTEEFILPDVTVAVTVLQCHMFLMSCVCPGVNSLLCCRHLKAWQHNYARCTVLTTDNNWLAYVFTTLYFCHYFDCVPSTYFLQTFWKTVTVTASQMSTARVMFSHLGLFK
jgi:hypothetical protein